jgi:hypothetical protein
VKDVKCSSNFECVFLNKGRKVGRMPIRAVEQVLGYGLTEIYKNDKIKGVQNNMTDKADLGFKEVL